MKNICVSLSPDGTVNVVNDDDPTTKREVLKMRPNVYYRICLEDDPSEKTWIYSYNKHQEGYYSFNEYLWHPAFDMIGRDWVLRSEKPSGIRLNEDWQWGVLSKDGKTWTPGATGWNMRDIDPDTGEIYLVYIGESKTPVSPIRKGVNDD